MSEFKENFVWGAATAACQIEGREANDGKGLDIWDVFCMEDGKIYNGQNTDQACMHIEHYKEDISLMKELGIKGYRMSINWSRLFPDGTGRRNEAGFELYDQIIDELLRQGIAPYITLYHWEMPFSLYKKGGWMNPDCVQWFAEYAKSVVEHFSDRVTHYFTLNEPQCFIGLGYGNGMHAPGQKATCKELFLLAHHVMMAHGNAVLAMRSAAKQPIEIGYAPTCGVFYPETESEQDIEAARKMYFGCNPDAHQALWSVSWWSDPVMLGTYPEEGLKLYEKYLPDIKLEDMKLIHQPLDMYGQNIYNGIAVRAGTDGNTEFVKRYDGFPRTALDWPVTPEALYWGPKFLYERYGKPVYITENGMSCHDWVSLDGKVHDPNRIDFTARYLQNLKRAAGEADIAGYFHWSMMDNFEWTNGYKERFGLVYVDYPTQKRIPKDSFYWYQSVIRENGRNL